MNNSAVLVEEYGHLSYPLGRADASHGQEFSEGKERFALFLAESEGAARSVLDARDSISRHASFPVGYVEGSEGAVFVVCRRGGRCMLVRPPDLEPSQRRAFSLSIVARLATLHSEGLGCGGIRPDAVELADGVAKLLNPSSIYALSDGESAFYEAACTLRALASSGFAEKSELEMLASAYVSFSPACRHDVVRHMEKKGMRGSAGKALADAARRYMHYF